MIYLCRPELAEVCGPIRRSLVRASGSSSPGQNQHGIEGFSHLLIIWVFDRANGFDLIGIPPTDNRQHGVFATCSPRRPNPIGLTVVELLRREGRLLHVQGVDMLDGTPILDIKPYLSSVPPVQLRRGWVDEAEARTTPRPVDFPADLRAAQNRVKELSRKRERLILDLRVEEAKVAQMVATLKEFGIANGDEMSVAEPKAAHDKT